MAVEITTQEQFEELLLNTKDKKYLVVDFYAQWCRPCKMYAPRFNELADLYGDQIAFCKVDVDVLEKVTDTYKVTALPTFKILAVGQDPVERVIHTVIGIGTSNKEDLEGTIQRLHAICNVGSSSAEASDGVIEGSSSTEASDGVIEGSSSAEASDGVIEGSCLTEASTCTGETCTNEGVIEGSSTYDSTNTNTNTNTN